MGQSQLDGCGQFMKYSLFFVNFIIFILGLTVCGLGIWTLVDNAQVEKVIGTQYYIPAAALLVTFGAVVAFISFLGCCGAIKEVKCLLGLFFVIMLILCIVIALGAIFGFVVKGKLGDELSKAMLETLKEYKPTKDEAKPLVEAWDTIQKELECCGVDSFLNWHQWNPETFPPNTFPSSCCKPEFAKCNAGSTEQYYHQGCVKAVEELVEKHAKPLAAVGIATAIVIILSMIFSCALCLMV